MIKKPTIGLGIDSFGELITEGCLYIDKTDLIREIIESKKKVTLFTRPRRFGKSLAQSMLAEFFDVTKKEQNAHLFDGLKISEYTELCKEHQNAYPVISLSFKDIRRPDFQRSFSVLRTQILSLSRHIKPLLDKVELDDGDIDILSRIESHTPTEDDIILFPYFVTKILNLYYGKDVIVLLDEYDVPIQNAFLNGFLKEMVGTISGMMSPLFKGNPYLKFGVVTGCLRITKESIFTGINNFLANTVLTKGSIEYFGFSPAETEQLLTDCGLAGEIETVRYLYDGYRFGSNDVYNPWSVLCFANQAMKTRDDAAQPYWMNTSGNDILQHIIDLYDQDSDTRDEIQKLIEGGSLTKKITENTTFSDLEEDPELIWSILLFTGYLKTKSGIVTVNDEDRCELVLPNQEIRKILLGKLSTWFSKRIKTTRLPNLTEKFLTGNPDDAGEEITEFISDAASLRDYSEDFYQGMLVTLMKPQNKEYKIASNIETGTGYADIVIEDVNRSIRAVLEIKRAETPNCPSSASPEKWDAAVDQSFESALDKAENQIRNRDYTGRKKPKKEFQTKHAYAVAFLNKECRIREVEI